jgi:hypothetical protein
MPHQDPFLENQSSKKNLWGLIESNLRKTRNLTFLFFYLLVVAICIFCMGSALAVGFLVFNYISSLHDSYWLKGISLALSFLSYGFSLIIIVPFVNQILFLPQLLKPFRGNNYSLEAIPWFLHNALLYLVRYTFLEFLTPSPFNVWFYKAMGMKVGKGVVINTTNISDACLISLGDYVTIGGSAHLLTHYSAGGYLIVSTLHIGKKSTIGLKATVFGNSKIGENCIIIPHSVVLPKTQIADNTKV